MYKGKNKKYSIFTKKIILISAGIFFLLGSFGYGVFEASFTPLNFLSQRVDKAERNISIRAAKGKTAIEQDIYKNALNQIEYAKVSPVMESMNDVAEILNKNYSSGDRVISLKGDDVVNILYYINDDFKKEIRELGEDFKIPTKNDMNTSCDKLMTGVLSGYKRTLDTQSYCKNIVNNQYKQFYRNKIKDRALTETNKGSDTFRNNSLDDANYDILNDAYVLSQILFDSPKEPESVIFYDMQDGRGGIGGNGSIGGGNTSGGGGGGGGGDGKIYCTIQGGPAHAHYINISTEIQEPANCEWECNEGYVKEGDSCNKTGTNETLVYCTIQGGPENAHYINIRQKISAPANCGWECNEGYTKLGNQCIESANPGGAGEGGSAAQVIGDGDRGLESPTTSDGSLSSVLGNSCEPGFDIGNYTQAEKEPEENPGVGQGGGGEGGGSGGGGLTCNNNSLCDTREDETCADCKREDLTCDDNGTCESGEGETCDDCRSPDLTCNNNSLCDTREDETCDDCKREVLACNNNGTCDAREDETCDDCKEGPFCNNNKECEIWEDKKTCADCKLDTCFAKCDESTTCSATNCEKIVCYAKCLCLNYETPFFDPIEDMGLGPLFKMKLCIQPVVSHKVETTKKVYNLETIIDEIDNVIQELRNSGQLMKNKKSKEFFEAGYAQSAFGNISASINSTTRAPVSKGSEKAENDNQKELNKALESEILGFKDSNNNTYAILGATSNISENGGENTDTQLASISDTISQNRLQNMDAEMTEFLQSNLNFWMLVDDYLNNMVDVSAALSKK